MWETIATFVSGAALALLARVPALSVDGRMVGRLERDTKLLPEIPDGPAHDAWLSMVNDQANAIVEYRREASNRALSRRRLALQGLGALVAVVVVVAWSWSIARVVDSTAFTFVAAASALAAGVASFRAFSSLVALRAARKALDRVSHREEVMSPILDALETEAYGMGPEVMALVEIPEADRTPEQSERLSHLVGRTVQIQRFLELLREIFPDPAGGREAPGLG